MSVITVAGAGTGGLVAAMKLASQGHDVTVYERLSEQDCGYEQKDAFDATAMEYAGIEIPDDFIAPGNDITFYPLDENIEPITTPSPENYKNITVDRKVLFRYLCSLAKDAGAKFVFETEITAPIILGSRICGIKTSAGDIYSDLVIDACGMNSPLRKNMPEFTAIDRETETHDYLHAYRAVFDRTPDVTEFGERYKIYINSDTGFTWIITEEDCVDVLIVDFNEIPFSMVADRLHKISLRNPQMGKNMIKNGKFMSIPIRQPLAVLVADGYAAVGDSAYMTYAAKGSGIAYSIKAGTMLANTVSLDEQGLFEAETLWDYQKTFYKEIGFDACRIALVKNLLPYMTADEINEIFKLRLVTSEELEKLINGDYQKSKLPGMIMDKIKLIGDLPEFRSQLLMLAGWFGKFAVIEPFLPGKYSREDADKWRDRYNKFFESVGNSSDSLAQAVEKAEEKKERKDKKAAQKAEKAEQKAEQKAEKAEQKAEKSDAKSEKKKKNQENQDTETAE